LHIFIKVLNIEPDLNPSNGSRNDTWGHGRRDRQTAGRDKGNRHLSRLNERA